MVSVGWELMFAIWMAQTGSCKRGGYMAGSGELMASKYLHIKGSLHLPIAHSNPV